MAPLQSIHNQQPAAALVERQEAGVDQPTTKPIGLGATCGPVGANTRRNERALVR